MLTPAILDKSEVSATFIVSVVLQCTERWYRRLSALFYTHIDRIVGKQLADALRWDYDLLVGMTNNWHNGSAEAILGHTFSGTS